MANSTLPCDRECQLLKETRALLAQQQKTLPHVATVTGIPFYWLKSFSEGRFKNPGVNRVSYLYTKLARKNFSI